MLKQLLETQPKARERSNKNRAIAHVILKKYNIEIDKGMLSDIVGEVLTLDRQWRKLLEDNPELRGLDYGEGKRLAQEKVLSLGYEVGQEGNVSKLQKLI